MPSKEPEPVAGTAAQPAPNGLEAVGAAEVLLVAESVVVDDEEDEEDEGAEEDDEAVPVPVLEPQAARPRGRAARRVRAAVVRRIFMMFGSLAGWVHCQE